MEAQKYRAVTRGIFFNLSRQIAVNRLKYIKTLYTEFHYSEIRKRIPVKKRYTIGRKINLSLRNFFRKEAYSRYFFSKALRAVR